MASLTYKQNQNNRYVKTQYQSKTNVSTGGAGAYWANISINANNAAHTALDKPSEQDVTHPSYYGPGMSK